MTPPSSIVRYLTRKSVRENALLFLAMALDVYLFSDLTVPDAAAPYGPHLPPVVLLGYAAIGYGLLLVRRRNRLAMLFVICLYSILGSLILSYSPVIPVCVAVAGVFAHCSKTQRIVGALVAVSTTFAWLYRENQINDFALSGPSLVAVEIATIAVVCTCAGIGWWIHLNERRSDERRKEAARAAVMAERQHLARELHDIVAHAVTLMVLQASGARAVMAGDPERASDALLVVEKTGTQAMAELRRLLGVLRSVPDGDSEGGAISLPPGLDELPELVEAVSSAGVNVSLHTEGEPHPIDRSVDAAAYRVVSESLTNVTKHSGVGATVEVEVTWSATHLTIDVRDDGAGAGPDERLSTGNGLLGLTERVVLVGGSFEARPRTTGGYEVHASLPLPAGDQAQPSPARAG